MFRNCSRLASRDLASRDLTPPIGGRRTAAAPAGWPQDGDDGMKITTLMSVLTAAAVLVAMIVAAPA